MKRTIYTILYYLDLLFSGIFAITAALSGLTVFTNILGDNPVINLFSFPISIIILVLSLLAELGLYYFRIIARRVIDFDEFGNSKRYKNYDKLSAKEKQKIDAQKLMDAERVLDSNTLRKLTHEGEKNPNESIEKLIGLTDVKFEMKKLAARMEYEAKYRKNKKTEKPSTHMCFIGPPGTGKTTCARIMTGYLYKYGYIKKNKCVEVDGNFLKGRTQGETSEKVTRLIQYAMDGVLFIDEAYSIVDKYGNGQEAIATLIKAMEDYRERIVLIFAGYDNEMKEFIDSNSGIFSRIKHYFTFGNYTLDELNQIFQFMANEKGYCVSAEAIDKFEDAILEEKKGKFFGNARSVRNILEKSLDTHAYNMMQHHLPKTKTFIICPEDITKNNYHI